MLTAMRKLTVFNHARRTTKPCPYCKGAGKSYRYSRHPKKRDCADTGVATNWR